MDLIRELKDVRFELNLRGYDCDAVDAFLAKVRTEVADLRSQQEAAQQRVSTLEDQLSSGESDTEGTLRRTLVLAQRLADETVADARKTATEMVETATAEAEDTRASAAAEAADLVRSANQEAAATRKTASEELEQARADAEATSETTATEAARSRASAVEEANRLLEEAEAAGATRVASLESAAQDEAARMREPIRAEVEGLEDVRSRLVRDIEALERHLADQRVRVRNAVDALRMGMSGSIEDLERVADDDELLASAERPTLSGAGGADVAEAPQIEIIDRVEEIAEPAPTAEQLSDEVRTAMETGEGAPTVPDDADIAPELDEAAPIEHEASDDLPPTEQIPVVEAIIEDATPATETEGPSSEEAVDDAVADWTDVVVETAQAETPQVETPHVESTEVAEAMVLDDGTDDGVEFIEGTPEMGAVEPIDVFAEAGVDHPTDDELVDLDAEGGALFGTDMAHADSDAVEYEASDSDAEVEPAIPAEESDGNFLAAFAEAIDTLPVGREG